MCHLTLVQGLLQEEPPFLVSRPQGTDKQSRWPKVTQLVVAVLSHQAWQGWNMTLSPSLCDEGSNPSYEMGEGGSTRGSANPPSVCTAPCGLKGWEVPCLAQLFSAS